MKRALIDNQTKYPIVPIRQAVRWVLREMDADLPSVIVRVAPYKGEGALGRFYAQCKIYRPRIWSQHSSGLEISNGARHLILSRIPVKGIPGRRMRGGPPPFTPADWIESLVCITAHETTHLRQFLFRKPGQPRWSEIEAEWTEYRLLRRWRERKT